MTPEVLHLIFAIFGLAVGWYVRHHSLGISPDVLAVVQKLIANQKESQIKDLLQGLIDSLRPPAAPPRS